MKGRIYWQELPGRAWHALVPNAPQNTYLHSICGRWAQRTEPKQADRVPADGHLCGNCSRIIAARTDER